MDPTRWLLSPLAVAWGAVAAARNAWYDRVPGATHAAGVPVISIGNLTVGGTGKTPLVIATTRELLAAGRRPAVLTRGYRAAPGQPADEVLELRAALPAVPVVVDADRVRGAVSACTDHRADCLVLDDGFQHRRLRRDLDIVLIDALCPWGGGWVLPAGRLREPIKGLCRAGLIVLTRVNQVDPTERAALRAAVAQRVPGRAVAEVGVAADALVPVAGPPRPPQDLSRRRVWLVCGLGNPETFARLAVALDARLVGTSRFRDHHRYTAHDAAAAAVAARAARAEWVVTTRKDWVKLAPLWPTDDPPLMRLDLRLEWLSGRETWQAALKRALETRA